MAAATTKMAALNSATSSNAIDPNADDNCDDAETGNAQESNGYEELPELQAVGIDRALHDELTAGPTRPTERLLKGQRAPANLPTAQAALLTPIRDERDPTTPTRRPCNPLPLEKSHIA
jgi:hypothetical protein